jgi:tetratricopeptide (TPR) repeat protein
MFVNRRIVSCLLLLVAGLPFVLFPLRSAGADDLQLCNDALADPDARIPACTRILEHPSGGINIAEVYSHRGTAKVRKGYLDDAVADFTSALNQSPEFVDALKNRGIARHKQGDYPSAIADFNRALRLDPKSPDLYNARGSALVSREQYDRAIIDFGKAISLDREYVNAYVNRGLVFYFTRQINRAIADFDMVVSLAAKNPLGYLNRAAARMDKGDFKGAVADYDEAIHLDPKNPSAYTRRGEMWRLQGDLERSLADHNRSIELSPNEDAYNNRALALKDQGKLDEAIADCNEAILLNSKYYLAWTNRGLLKRVKGDLWGSLTDLNEAVDLDPRSPIALTFRGDTLRESGDIDRAIKDFNDALLILPDFVAAYTGRGLAYEKKNEWQKAKADFEKALSLSAESDAGLAKPAQTVARERLVALAAQEVKRDKETAERAVKVASEARAKAEADEGAKAEFEARAKAEFEARVKAEVEARAIAAAAQPDEPIPDAGNRVALVIGNSSYREVPALPNPRRDAEAVAAALSKVGFQTVLPAVNVTREKLLAALHTFEEKVEQADWAVIYYAGHGLEVGGENYLIPVDAKLYTDRDVQDEAVSLERLLQSAVRAKRLRLVILDACRANPFVSRMRRIIASRSIGRGLASIEPGGGTLVAYATKDGQTAEDGDGKHSPFAQAFLNNVIKRRLEINMLFRQVRDEVFATTGGRQEPFTYGSLPGESFYFVTK